MSKTYKVAVIGSTGRGNYGHSVDVAWQAIPQTEVVAVADDNQAGLAAAAKRLKIDRTFSDWREMLRQVRPDITAICPRWIDRHRDMAVAAARQGSHIYMEKPFCRDLQEADDIVEACRQGKVKLAVAHPTRYSPKLATIGRLIAAGKIGKVLEYRARGKEDRRGGGEDLWVLGTHVLDMIQALGGTPQWCFARLTQNEKPVTVRDVRQGGEGIGPLAGDAVAAMYGMADGSTAYFHSVKDAAGSPSRYGLQIFGSRGVLELVEGTLPSVHYLDDPSWSPQGRPSQWQSVSSAGIGKAEPLEGPEYRARHTLAIRDLLAAIENDRQPLCGAVTARSVTEMIVAVLESHRTGGPVRLPLENRRHPLTMLEA